MIITNPGFTDITESSRVWENGEILLAPAFLSGLTAPHTLATISTGTPQPSGKQKAFNLFTISSCLQYCEHKHDTR